MSDTRQIRAAFPLDAIHPDIACGHGGIHERCDLHRLCDEHDAMLAACENTLAECSLCGDGNGDECMYHDGMRAAVAKARKS